MIRINLLPVSDAARQKSGRQFLTLMLILVAAEILALMYLQSEKDQELKNLERQNATISKSIKRLKKKTSAVTALKAEQKELEQQKAVLDSLVEGQSGPVKMLDELSQMLTPIEDPAQKLQVRSKGWNPDWDTKRLWIDQFLEKRRKVQLVGHARSNEDLAEFLERLNSSKHFVKVRLRESNAIVRPELNDARLMKFTIDALAIYGPADVRRLSAGTLDGSK
ncbi:MAG: PilN domain-containing protein [Myxococcota bacterium]|nr:PilN domain-containing protein [Myxococcota bacterium]